jgi:WD40 repeat protein
MGRCWPRVILGEPLSFWDLEAGTNVARLEAKHNRLTLLRFTPDGKTLITGDSLDRTVRLFDVATLKERHQITRPDVVRGFDLAPNGNLLALGAQKGPTSIWDVRTGDLVRELRGESFVGGVAFSPDGSTLAAAEFEEKGRRDAIVLWDVATGKVLHRLQDKAGPVWSVAFASDGKTVIAGSSGTIRLWDVITGEELGPVPGNPGYVGSVIAAPAGQTLAYTANSSIRLWDLAAGREVARLPGDHWSIALSRDGKILACGTDVNKVNLWDVPARRLVRRLESDPKKAGYDWVAYYRVAFSSDGKLIAAAGRALYPVAKAQTRSCSSGIWPRAKKGAGLA